MKNLTLILATLLIMTLLSACNKDVSRAENGITVGTPPIVAVPVVNLPGSYSQSVQFSNHGETTESTTRYVMVENLVITLPSVITTNYASKSTHPTIYLKVNGQAVCSYTWQSSQYQQNASTCTKTGQLHSGDVLTLQGLSLSEIITLTYSYEK